MAKRRPKREPALVVALRNALGLGDREQLALAVDGTAQASPPAQAAPFVKLEACRACGRRGYHLAHCPRRNNP